MIGSLYKRQEALALCLVHPRNRLDVIPDPERSFSCESSDDRALHRRVIEVQPLDSRPDRWFRSRDCFGECWAGFKGREEQRLRLRIAFLVPRRKLYGRRALSRTGESKQENNIVRVKTPVNLEECVIGTDESEIRSGRKGFRKAALSGLLLFCWWLYF